VLIDGRRRKIPSAADVEEENTYAPGAHDKTNYIPRGAGDRIVLKAIRQVAGRFVSNCRERPDDLPTLGADDGGDHGNGVPSIAEHAASGAAGTGTIS